MSDLVEFGLGVIAGTLAFWLRGGVLARLGGPLLVLVGALGLGVQGGYETRALAVAAGVLLWLAGHWHYALCHRGYKSRLARCVFSRWAPDWLNPTANWVFGIAPDRVDRDV